MIVSISAVVDKLSCKFSAWISWDQVTSGRIGFNQSSNVFQLALSMFGYVCFAKLPNEPFSATGNETSSKTLHALLIKIH